jgi:hypothetical protein
MSSTAVGGHASSSLRVTLVARANPLDLLALTTVLTVLFAVFALPEATRRSLAFAYYDPTALTALSAHYLHSTPATCSPTSLVFDLIFGRIGGWVTQTLSPISGSIKHHDGVILIPLHCCIPLCVQHGVRICCK